MTPPEPMNDGAPELEQDEQDAPAGTVRPVLIVRCRSDGILTFANDAYCRAVGRTRAEIAGQTFWAFLPSQERQRGRRHLKSLTPDEPAAAIEYALDARPGRSRPQRWMVHARFDDAGRLIEWSGTGEEVAEESLDWLTDATLHAAILAALPDPFVLFSARGDYLRFRAPQNAPRDETSNAVIGRNIRDALPASIADGLQAAFDRTLASGAVNTLEYTVEDGGKERVLEARIARCAPELLLALIRDRTEERQTAQALGRAEAEARDLQQEIALLGQVASLGVLAGSIAHELNQPLMSTATNAQAAIKFLSAPTPDLDEARAALADIGHSTRRLADMVRHLLDKLKTHAIAHVPLDLNAVAADVIRLVDRQPRARGVDIESQLATNLPRVSGDRIQLQQVMLNLLLNACDAVDATRSGSRCVIVRTERDQEDVSVSFIDSGIGIPAGDLPRVFEPFYTTKPHGTGLGLAISRTILTLHGARLTATPNPEGGMTFSFRLRPAPARQARSSSRGI